MANIRERTDTPLDLRPSEVGVEATAAAARRGGAFFNQAAGAFDALGQRAGSAIRDAGEVAVKYEDHQQISAGAANGAQLIENLNKSWEQTAKKADPNDPSHAAKWREETLGPALEQFQSGFTTEKSQQWAEHFVDQARTHMFQKTAADMSGLAADAVHINTLKTINSLGNTLSTDPSGLDFARNALKSSLDGLVDSSPNLTAAQAAKVRNDLMFKGEEHLVKSAVTGAILKGGDWQSLANDPKNSPFINANEMLQFEKAAKAQQRSERLTQIQLERYGHQQLVLSAEQGLGNAWNENVSFDDNGTPTIKPGMFKQIMEVNRQTEGVATPRAEAMINWAQSKQREKKETIITDKAVQSGLYDRLFRTENSTTDVDILKASAQGKIDAHDTAALLHLQKALEEAPLKGPIYHDTMAAVKGALGDSEKGHLNYANFIQTFVPEYIRQKRAGTLPPNALDLRNPESLISKSLEPWRLTPQEKLMGRILKNIGGEMPGSLGNVSGQGENVISTTTFDVPPAPKREVGKTYDLPSGKFIWRGTGWEPKR